MSPWDRAQEDPDDRVLASRLARWEVMFLQRQLGMPLAEVARRHGVSVGRVTYLLLARQTAACRVESDRQDALVGIVHSTPLVAVVSTFAILKASVGPPLP